jgi:predicted CXXCH cytochrome family protein
MKRLKQLLCLLPALLVLTLSAPVHAGDKEGGVGPVIPAPVKGKQCVRDTADMRRNHMKYLLKHRTETLREGIRTKKYSLKECLSCHVPADNTVQAGEAHEGNHFCMNCHAYVGVSIDCFECHNTTPQKTAQFHPLVSPAMKALKSKSSAETLNQLAAGETNTGAMQ